MKKIILFLIVLSNSCLLFAQPIYNKDGIRLYHHLSAEEAALYKSVQMQQTATAAPVGQIRPIAEYEPAEAVLVRYPFGIPMALIKELAKDIKVITIVANTSQKNTVLSQYNSNGVNTANCDFLIASTDTYWTRDYGPYFLAINNSQVAMYDFTYNRPRPNDNLVNSYLATYLSMDRYSSTIQQTGGNYMNDGTNQAASTDLVLEENSTYTQQQLETHFQQYLGIENYHFTADPLSDYIKHIDCWGKYLSPTKVMIGKVAKTDSRYQQFENIANYFASLTTAYGTPYQVYRVYTPGAVGSGPATPYTNSLILNKKVFVAITGNSNDAAALQSYRDAMPGYQVIGISYSDWIDTDALHCRTHEIADRCMLYVKHQPYFGEIENTGNLTFNAQVYSYCNNTIYPDSVIIYLKTNNSSEFTPYNMTYAGNNEWTTTISGLPSETIEYYVFAADESGRRENKPYIGAADPYKFTLIGTQSSSEKVNFLPINIYPNPAFNYINIENNTNSTQAEIYNIFGQQIKEISISNGINSINIKELPVGIYFIEVNDNTFKFIKQ